MPNRREVMLGLGAAATSYWPTQPLWAEEDPESQPRPASCILVWLDGGPSTVDMWHLPSDPRIRGPFKPIPTAGDMEISEHLPQVAGVMDELSVVISMSSPEASHDRAHYYAHTGFTPNPNVKHPGAGSVLAQQLAPRRPELKLPSVISINGATVGAGYLQPQFAPYFVDSDGRFLERLDLGADANVFKERISALQALDGQFAAKIGSFVDPNQQAKRHALKVVQSGQLDVFRVDQEDAAIRNRYGNNDFGRSMLMARRLVQAGVPFVEVTQPGWNDHKEDYFDHMQRNLLPQLDSGLSALVLDLKAKNLLRNTVLVVMGAYGRTPRILKDNQRYPWARSWSMLMGGGGLRGGQIVGKRSPDGFQIVSDPIRPKDVWATVAKSMEIDMGSHHTTPAGRSMKIFDGGQPIHELLGGETSPR